MQTSKYKTASHADPSLAYALCPLKRVYKHPRRRSATPAPASHPTPIYASDIPYSQYIHVSGTELQGTFERWNRGVDVYYYPTSGAEFIQLLCECTYNFLPTYRQCDEPDPSPRPSRTTLGIDFEVAWAPTFGAERGSFDSASVIFDILTASLYAQPARPWHDLSPPQDKPSLPQRERELLYGPFAMPPREIQRGTGNGRA
ncbi:hypothetical protein B0H13DRAFT_1892010 [Mycena leptocephala]|nr:hypothetical protein B0H13DRAFT_1892010 [Mycena leptocephala]